MAKSQRVLIVDDDRYNRTVLQGMVESLGYEVKLAQSGREALEKLGPDVDIVLLDVMMPEMDGFEVARRIRNNPSTRDIPVVMVTVLDSKADRLLAVEAGANDFISKPIDMVELRVRMASLLKVKSAQDQVRASLKEKEILLREIHHRVKNNLAIVSSILGLQSRYAVDEFHRQMFRETRDRIKSMAIAHEKLYRSESLSQVNLREYVRSLVDHLFASSNTLGSSVTLKKKVDDVSVGIETIVPLGMILTELISNSLRHAFPDGRQGEVTISFHSTGPGTFCMIVKDNGVGISEKTDLNSPRSFGLSLVTTLCSQIGGKIHVSTTGGTEFRLELPAERDMSCAGDLGSD